MQSYKTYAAITLIANTFEILPEVGCRLPHSVIAKWMEHNDIEPEDVLYASPDVVKAKLVSLISNNLPQITRAARTSFSNPVGLRTAASPKNTGASRELP